MIQKKKQDNFLPLLFRTPNQSKTASNITELSLDIMCT